MLSTDFQNALMPLLKKGHICKYFLHYAYFYIEFS